MMKTLYLDCGMGAAGDMLAAALLELLPDPDGFVQTLNGLGLPGVEFRRETSVKCGITGTHLSVTVNGCEEESLDHDHSHEHDHPHEHGHPTTTIIPTTIPMTTVMNIITATHTIRWRISSTSSVDTSIFPRRWRTT